MYIEPNYNNFSTEDFVWDPEFRQWVLNPDADLDIFWSEWLDENPDKSSQVRVAREVVKAIFVKNPHITNADIKVAIQRVMAELNASDPNVVAEPARRSMWPTIWRFTSAAAVLLLVAGAAVWYMRPLGKHDGATYADLVQTETVTLTERINDSAAPMQVKLADGSVISLAAKSRISYPVNFTAGAKRNVYLTGRATFEVAKDPSKPFFVYANGLIVKVLGTKFDVRSYQGEEKASVEVKSGIVSVFSYIGNKEKQVAGTKTLNTLILTRNQKADYSSVDKTLTATIVDKPVLSNESTVRYNFNETPLPRVLKDITQGYGIDIVYDEKTLSKLTLSADLEGTTLYQKMDVICKTVDARYEVIDGKVVIYMDNKTVK